jgi:aspartokinase-like uncharacterized kinase
MIVIKLGGSLATAGTLANCLESIERKYRGSAVVVVPGGGLFADQVRLAQQQWNFDDVTAHRMALLAMQQMALLINGLKPHWRIIDRSERLHAGSGIAIWSPAPDELDQAGVAASWNVTSDSLAVWLAGQLSADELILVKSAAIRGIESLPELAARQVVDKAFCSYAAHAQFKITIINQHTFHG